jgi:hypothetical protein
MMLTKEAPTVAKIRLACGGVCGVDGDETNPRFQSTVTVDWYMTNCCGDRAWWNYMAGWHFCNVIGGGPDDCREGNRASKGNKLQQQGGNRPGAAWDRRSEGRTRDLGHLVEPNRHIIHLQPLCICIWDFQIQIP